MKLGFIGTGNMAGAIMGGIIRNGVLKPEEIIGSDILEAGREKVHSLYGICVTDDNREAAKAEIVVLSVKPQYYEQTIAQIRDEIMDAQNSFRKKANIVSEILSTMQNLYKVANKQEVIKIQDEFYKIYETGDMEQLIHFNKQLDIIAEGYRAQSLS